MNATLFLAYLPFLRYPEERYLLLSEQDGWNKEEISKALEWGIAGTTPLHRRIPLEIENLPSELISLYGNYNLEKIHMLAGTNFWSEPKKLEQGWGFADMSEANIVVAPSGRIEAYNAHPIRGMPGATDCLGVLAKDLESYLEGLFYAQFNKTHFISGFPDEDPIRYQKTVLVAKHCALIAGGYEYYDFWAGILGLPYSETVPE